MLDLGFLPDVETLLARVPENRHHAVLRDMPGPVVAPRLPLHGPPDPSARRDPDDETRPPSARSSRSSTAFTP